MTRKEEMKERPGTTAIALGTVVAVVLAAGALGAMAVEVTFEWPSAAPSPSQASVELLALRPGTGPAQTLERTTLPWGAPSHVLSPQDGAGSYLVQILAAGCWSAAAEWRGGALAVRCDLPAAVAFGSFEVERGEAPPTHAEGRLRPPAGARGQALPGGAAELVTLCSAGGEPQRLRCVLPLGTWDLELRFGSDRAPLFFPALAVTPEPLDLGKMRPQRGASVAGRLVLPRDAPAEKAVIEGFLLSPRLQEQPKPVATGTARPDGTFTVSGLPAGEVELKARLEGQGEGRSEPFGLELGQLRWLDAPLAIVPLAALDLVVEPPAYPGGSPWTVLVRERVAGAQHERLRTKFELAPSGRARLEKLPAGKYTLSIRSPDGSSWADREATVAGHDELLQITTDLVEVRGTHRFGDDGAPALLRFVLFREGGRQVKMRADEEGVFSGYLPKEGRWAVEVAGDGADEWVTLEEVEIRKGPRGYAEVEIARDDTKLAGRVVDRTGAPQSGAQVFVTRRDKDGNPSYSAALKTNARGEFRARGLVAGPTTLFASTARARSAPREVELAAGREGTVELMVEERLEVRGRVRCGGGQAPSALVAFGGDPTAAEAGSEGQVVGTARDGSLALSLPQGSYVAIVRAAGCATGIRRFVVAPPAAATFDFQLSPSQGALELRPGPGAPLDGELWLAQNGAVAPLQFLFRLGGQSPASASDQAGETVLVANAEPGSWLLCRPRPSLACSGATVSPVDSVSLAAPSRSFEPDDKQGKPQ